MYSQFFGNFLLINKYVTKEQLFDAMQKQSNDRIKLGTLAISEGLMTAEEVDEVIIQQTHEDKKFGELAIEQGFLTNDEVLQLLKAQVPSFLQLAQTFVDEEILTNQDLANIITEYRSESEIYDLDFTSDDQKDTIEKLFDNFFVMSETPLSHYGRMYLELLFNNFIRFIGEDFTPLDGSAITEFAPEKCVCQKVIGDYSVVTYIDMDEDTAVEFASRYVGDQFSEYDEYVSASLEDFINLHNGVFIVNVSNEDNTDLELDIPYGVKDPLLIFDKKAYLFPVMYSFGVVNIILEVIKIETEDSEV
ncbi:hypothetical protein SAMN04487761_11061 [Lachnospiraceae bacterium C7]|nr:hypothetical protein SAMN04487761_11061 [Lachnospiraceae bacterium C7]